jgi:hypothetical protein
MSSSPEIQISKLQNTNIHGHLHKKKTPTWPKVDEYVRNLSLTSFNNWSDNGVCSSTPKIRAHDNRRSSVFYMIPAMSSARQRSCKHASLIEEMCFLCSPFCVRCYAARNKQAAIIETVFRAWSLPTAYKRHGK